MTFCFSDHNLKRSMCKACHSPLIAGETATVRLMTKKRKMIKTTCCTCGNAKKIPTKKKHNLWAEQPQALLETFEYSLKKRSIIDSNNAVNGNKGGKNKVNVPTKKSVTEVTEK